MNVKLGNIDERHTLLPSAKMLLNSLRQLRRLRRVPGVLDIPRTRSEEEDVVLAFEVFQEAVAPAGNALRCAALGRSE